MNLMVQQFQNLKSNQEENKAGHNPPKNGEWDEDQREDKQDGRDDQ